MIASLTGRLTAKFPTHVTLDVHGVGYELFIPLSTFYALPNLEETTRLCVYTHLREDAIQLYGFSTDAEKTAFLLLTTVTGIGPKLGLSVLSTLSIQDLIATIRSGDVEKLATVPGVGKKSASRLVLELKDKVEHVPIASESGEASATVAYDELYADALSALLNLGYRAADAKLVLKRLPMDRLTLKEAIRTALQELAKG